MISVGSDGHDHHEATDEKEVIDSYRRDSFEIIERMLGEMKKWFYKIKPE